MLPEQKPKITALAISKIILAAVILICFSTVLGVAGYLAMNKPVASREPQVSITPEPTVTATPIVKDEITDLSSKALATEDWKTYRNEKLGYEVKYPSQWFGYEGTSTFDIPAFTVKKSETWPDVIWISVYKNPKGLTEKDWLEKEFVKDEDNAGLTYMGKAVISEKNADVYKEETSFDYVLANDSNIYFISVQLNKEDTDKILSTFKFTEKK